MRRAQDQILHPSGPLSRWKVWFGSNHSQQVQAPVPLGTDEKYAPPFGHLFPPNGAPHYSYITPFDYGSANWSYRADRNQLATNPIGAGIVATLKPPITPSATATVVNNSGIYWNAQRNGGGVPFGPLYDPDTLRALVGDVAAPAVVPNPYPYADPFGAG